MNLVVRPEGTAELDERAATDIVAKVLPDGRVMTINVTTDNGHTMVTKVLFDPTASVERESHLAALMMLHLTGQHFYVPGEAIFAELDPTLALELLELARD